MRGTARGSVSGGNANGVGTFTYTATGTDRAGNTATRTVKYRVVYAFGGFLSPDQRPGHESLLPQTSVFKARKHGAGEVRPATCGRHARATGGVRRSGSRR